MGLTGDSTGVGAIDSGLVIKKRSEREKIIALAGNPNVGKSTVFNELTGMRQHTGNWPGKTVANAQGRCGDFIMVDIPGCYSLMAHSAEEEVARDFICFGNPDAVVVVCDATCLERNMNLVLQILEITDKAAVCINLMDEAEKKQIKIDIKALSEKLGVPVIPTAARSGKGLEMLKRGIDTALNNKNTFKVEYTPEIERIVFNIQRRIERICCGKINSRWLALRIIDGDAELLKAASEFLGEELPCVDDCFSGIDRLQAKDDIVSAIVKAAEKICKEAILFEKQEYNARDRRIDKVLTSRLTGFPVMILMLAVIFWITITGANYPSQLLSDGLFWLEDRIFELFVAIRAPEWLTGMLVFGVYRVLAWVISVMLPPMAIFFPLFTLLEDLGYLPRVAFNLDKCFKKCCACGKQALTMCMGFGCNAAGIIGCRIIDSPRERLIAMLTNNFVPCNGRFPTLIAIITMFFIGGTAGWAQSALSAIGLAGIIVVGVAATFAASKLLSKTVLKGVPSSFTLELPPYRRPQIGKVIVRSIADRTLFVLGRAAAVAAPAGLIIWIMANIQVDGVTLLAHCAGFLDPFARAIGLDGIILMAFILGLPANEIIVPIIIMAYMAQGSLMDMGDINVIKALLADNGWTWVTAMCTMIFSLMHWPCSTTLITIKKESGSFKWMMAAAALPTAFGLVTCFIVANVAKLCGF